MAQQNYDPKLEGLLKKLAEGTEQLKSAIASVKENGNEYMDLHGRELVDIAIDLINGYLFCGQASTETDMKTISEDGTEIAVKERKAVIAQRYIDRNAPKIASLAEVIRSGDKSTFNNYPILIGPVSSE